MEHFKQVFDAAMEEVTELKKVRVTLQAAKDYQLLVQVEKTIIDNMMIAHNAIVQIQQIRVFGASQNNVERIFDHMDTEHGDDPEWKERG